MWSTLESNGKRIELFETSGDRPRFALIFLHDRDGQSLRSTTDVAEILTRNRLACFCPDGGESWWSNRVCLPFDPARSAEQWLLDDVVPLVHNRFNLASNAIALVGIGMGGQGAMRLGFKHPVRFPIVASLDAALDHHELFHEGTPLDEMYPSREHCRQDTAILHIRPIRQPAHLWFAADPASRWFRGNDRLHEKLSALGVSHQFEIGEKGNLEAMFRFLVESLKKESRRLI